MSKSRTVTAHGIFNTSIISRPNTQICTDIKASFPVISFSVCGDEDVNSLIGALGLSASWDIVSAESAPFKMGFHYEVLPDETAQFVKKCTYRKQEENKEERNDDSKTKLNTYHTRYGEVNHTDTPIFYFDYPQHWQITKEEIDGNVIGIDGGGDKEYVELTNDRGVTITFIMFDSEVFQLGGRGAWCGEYEVFRVTEAQLVPFETGGSNEEYVVAKLKLVGEFFTGTDLGYLTVEEEWFRYAIIEWENREVDSQNMMAFGAGLGFEEMISFNYPIPYVFFAKSPDGTFTEQEEKEVIEILASFRTQ